MNEFSETPSWLRRVAILGVGLLGGSVGMSLRRRGITVNGYSRRQSGCQRALRAQAIDQGFTSIESTCRDCDVVVVAAPVDKIASLAVEANRYLADDALITDVGSTKARIVDELACSSAMTMQRLVPAHPIAGSEKTGVEHATANLLDQKVIVITPHDENSAEQLDRARSFWNMTGGRLIEMSPHDHDQRLAAISHVPHLVASLLALFPDEESLPLVGSGWKDMTRVAAGDPGMWLAICQHNRQAVLSQLERFSHEIEALRTSLQPDADEQLRQWLERAKRRKDSMDK